MDLPKKETESRQANEHALGVAFDADSRGDIRFCRYCGLRDIRATHRVVAHDIRISSRLAIYCERLGVRSVGEIRVSGTGSAEFRVGRRNKIMRTNR